MAALTVAELPDEAKMPVPANAYVPPGRPDPPEAVSVRVVRVQVSILLLATRPAVGAVVFWPTTTLAMLLQPFWSVAVTEYVPDVLTTRLLLITLPVQRRAVAEEVAVSVRLVWVQVRVPLVGAMVSVGNEVSVPIVAVVNAVCPVALATVRV